MIKPATAMAELPPDFCPKCGQKVLRACTNCSAILHGRRLGDLVANWVPDDFCYRCGLPYPWASREAIVYHIENQLERDPDLQEGDKRNLREQLNALRDSPADPVAEKRQVAALSLLKRTAPKIWEVVVPVAQSILTAEMKHQLGLPPV